MEHELYSNTAELDLDRLQSLVREHGDSHDISCLVGNSESEKQELLKQHGFRYAGKRLVEGTVLSVYTRFSDVSEPCEAMDLFFDRRVRDYDLHMRDGIDDYEASFATLFRDIPVTGQAIQVLDLGCGTGAELRYLFDRVPKALVTCIDVSGLMLAQLLETYREHRSSISIRKDSYLTVSLEAGRFDVIVACSTFHHLLPNDKQQLYRRVKSWLKPRGKLLIKDYVAITDELERLRQEEYARRVADGTIEPDKLYHFDLPLTVEHERELLMAAGLVCTRIEKEGESGVLITAVKT